MSEWTKELPFKLMLIHEHWEGAMCRDEHSLAECLSFCETALTRIGAEHNALAGIPDPAAAIEAAREALDDASEALEGSVTDEFYMATRAKLRAALALLEAKQ